MKLTQFRDSVNFRDLGGITAADGRKIRNGLFYRSGGLYLLNQQEMEEFRKLNIKTVIDLRTEFEVKRKPDPDLGEATVHRHSGVTSTGGEEINFSPAGMLQIGQKGHQQLEALKQYYRDMPYHNDAFRLLFEQIRNNDLPVLFHCASGKDRTGVAAMLVLGLLGCERQTILDDYLLSNQYSRQKLLDGFASSDVDPESFPERKQLLIMMHGVSKEVGVQVIDGILNRYGCFEKFLEAEYGFTVEEITAIRNRCLQ